MHIIQRRKKLIRLLINNRNSLRNVLRYSDEHMQNKKDLVAQTDASSSLGKNCALSGQPATSLPRQSQFPAYLKTPLRKRLTVQHIGKLHSVHSTVCLARQCVRYAMARLGLRETGASTRHRRSSTRRLIHDLLPYVESSIRHNNVPTENAVHIAVTV